MSAPSRSRWRAFSVRPPSARRSSVSADRVEPEVRARGLAQGQRQRPDGRGIGAGRRPSRRRRRSGGRGTTARHGRRPTPRARRGSSRRARVVGHRSQGAMQRAFADQPDGRVLPTMPGRPRRKALPRHPPAAGRLDLEEPEPLHRSPRDRLVDRRAGGRCRPRRGALGGRSRRVSDRRPHDERPTVGLDERPGPRLEGAHPPLELRRSTDGDRGARPRAGAAASWCAVGVVLRRGRRARRRSHAPGGPSSRPAPSAASRASSVRRRSPCRRGRHAPGRRSARCRDPRPCASGSRRSPRRRQGSRPGSAWRRGGAAGARDGGSALRAARSSRAAGTICP